MKKNSNASVFELDGIPSIKQVLPLALQHVVAMIVGCVTPAIIIGQVANLSPSDEVIFVQAALVIAGLSTLIQLFPIGRKIGSGLPVIMGVSFAYLPSMQAIAGTYDIATIFGAQIIGGIAAIIVGIYIKKLRLLFPPIVTGTVVFTIGLSLYPTAINYMAGGASSGTYGSIQNWLVALFTLIIVIVLNHFGKGILKLASILIAIICGYILAFCLNMVDLSAVSNASLLQLPIPLYFGVKFELSAIVTFVILFTINSIQAIGDLSATTTGGLDRQPTEDELQGGIVAYGFTNIFGALFGGLPTATFSQNVGIVATTRVVNRFVLGFAAAIIILAGFVPAISAVLTSIPQCVLGGATITVFASIAMTGMKLIASQDLNYRNTSIVGLAVALGMGVTSASASLATFPSWITLIFGKSPVVLATIVAIILNLILPKEKKSAK